MDDVHGAPRRSATASFPEQLRSRFALKDSGIIVTGVSKHLKRAGAA